MKRKTKEHINDMKEKDAEKVRVFEREIRKV